MQLRHILAAADDSPEGRLAVLIGARLSALASARFTVLTVAQAVDAPGMQAKLLQDLRRMVYGELAKIEGAVPEPVLAVAAGLPGIEIGRYAETEAADLVVVGRKRRSELQRLLIGDTADSVARRSRTPCLFVKAGQEQMQRVLVSLDGTERGMAVLLAAMDFTRAIAARLHAVTVEQPTRTKAEAPRLLTGRSAARLAQAVDDLRQSTNLGGGEWEVRPSIAQESPLVIQRGRVVDAVLTEVERSQADVLVLGYHRGGLVRRRHRGLRASPGGWRTMRPVPS
ncbi:MAG: universal stress protein [Gemmatimonadetes bacterium]|nr:universal stress protein [Gemmatimonadota bacterium]